MGQTTSAEQPPGGLDRDVRRLFRVGAWCALALVAGYVVIVALYARVGVPPSGGQAWVSYGAGKSGPWWVILGLSVVTDLLYLPIAIALYQALKQVSRYGALSAAGLLAGFVGLDLAVTWPNYASLISLSSTYAAAADASRRAAYAAAADYPSVVLSSRLEAFYSITIPAVGILIAGVLMCRGPFTKATAVLAVAIGLLGLAATVGPAFTHALDITVILESIGTTIWFLLLARDLHRLATADFDAPPKPVQLVAE